MVERFTRAFPPPGEVRVYTVQIPPGEIVFLQSIIESYEGIGLVRTCDAKNGIIEIWVMTWAEEVMTRILEDLAGEIPFMFLKEEKQPYEFKTP